MIEAAGSLLESNWLAGGRRFERFVVLDTDFGDAQRFLDCWQRWRSAEAPLPEIEPHRGLPARCSLHVILIASQLPTRGELQAGWTRSAPPADGTVRTTWDALATELLAAWPPAVPGLHRLAFECGRVQLMLAAGGDVRHWLAQLSARVDAFFLDGAALAGDGDAAWPLRLFKAVARLAAPGATLTMPAAGSAARAALRSAGFVLSGESRPDAAAAIAETAAAAGDNILHAHYAPAFAPRRPAHHPAAADASTPPAAAPHVWIIGAGLAGCATAWALAEAGWHGTLLDSHDAPAGGASGNPAGLFHGIVHPQDGAHARFNRAAALEAARAVRTAIERHGVSGDVGGLLRVQASASGGAADTSSMERTVRSAGLPADYVRIVDAEQASALAGMPITHACWLYPGGGWVQPAGLARAFLERAGERVRFIGGVTVASLRRIDEPLSSGNTAALAHGSRKGSPQQFSAGGTRWQMIDSSGRVLGESAVVVLAHAGDASALLGAPPATVGTSNPLAATSSLLQAVRGQLSWLPVAELARALPGLVLPRLPVVGSGWLLPAVDGLAVFGATAQAGDGDPGVRPSDHAANIAALGRLTGLHFATEPPQQLQGRTAWRCVTADRLPLIGAVPCAVLADEPASRRAEPIPRLPGLYTFSALGSRGITWAALGAQVLASLITGAPVPLARGLIEAVDPGRFLLRQQRRRSSPQ